MRLGRLLPLLAVLLLAPVLILLFGAQEGPYQVYVPSGYVKEVDRLIREGKLAYDCRRQTIEPAGLTDGELFFLRNSYLSGDLAAWNAGDRRPFVVEREELPGGRCRGEVVRVSASFHNQRLPAYTASSWRGRLYLRQGLATVTLSSPDRLLEVARPPWRRLPLPARAYEDAWLGPGRGDVRSERLALKLFEAGRMFASLEHVGDQVALEVYHQRPELLLNGCSVPRGWRLRLEGGDQVWFQEPGRVDERYQVESGDAAGLVSFVSVVNGELRRKTLGHRLGMARELAWAVDAAVTQDEGGRDDFDVHLTLDAFFQDLLERRLGAFCRERYGRRPLRAAVTLLEPGSGRALALASYPATGDVERLRLKQPAHAGVLARNHNFLQHPVGSATKPFLAAAALATQPRLARLTLPCFPGGEPPESLLGYDLGTYNLPPDCGADGSPVDFRRFLEVSSNRYMLALGMLALADWRGGLPLPDGEAPELPPLDRYRLAGETQSRRPVLPVVKDESRPGATELAGAQDEELFRDFRDLFGHRVHYRAGAVAADLESDYWSPVLAAAGGGEEAALAFSAVTPERVNLRANLIQQLRQDLYTTLLGLGNNRWSNLQLAESLARLVTGNQLQARLVERVAVPAAGRGGGEGGEVGEGGGEDEEGQEGEAGEEVEAGSREPAGEVLWDLEELLATPPPALPLDDEPRRLILDGMADVVSAPRGTAHDLAPVLAALNRRAPEGVRYSALAKTGTPTTDLAIVQRGPSEPAPEAIETYSGRRQVKDGLLLLALTRSQGGSTQELILILYVEAQGGSDEAVALAAELLPPLAEAYWPEDWLEEQ